MISRPVHILVVDDDPGMRKTLAQVLVRFGYQVDLLSSAEETLAFLDQHTCDLVLLDLYLTGMSGLEFLRTFEGRPLPVQVLVLTGYPEVESAVEALRLGACDYLKKSPDFELLRQKIDLALKGQPSRAAQAAGTDLQLAAEVRLAHQEVRRLDQHLATLETMVGADEGGTKVASEEAGAGSVLSGREQEVLVLIGQGQAVKQIAAALGISERTVWTLRQRLLKKLELQTTAALISYAIRHGLAD